jgi:hypothetical protein
MIRVAAADPDKLDEEDLAAGRDLHGEPPPAPHPTPHPPRSVGKVKDLAERYRLRLALFRDDAKATPGDNSKTTPPSSPSANSSKRSRTRNGSPACKPPAARAGTIIPSSGCGGWFC